MHSDFVISRADGRPMYLQIIEQIKHRIAMGDWPVGAEIPSIRQLAVALQVSVITIKRVYEELEREGVIVTQQGKGSRVARSPSTRPYDRDLADHIDRAARLGMLLGLSPRELASRMREAADRINEETA